ncbi:hypothetical protein HMPREF0580_1915 [Mobiluncus mulieris ATCC 35239]|uniref:Putative Flp pilus-assembly TadG-like N-terminal domain-containing protein n=3 Tax=Mobiluncus mulieris TaxID=2052 RepID=E0QSQ0_9ACTO|nr:hypothetical protein HMPREF0577_1273 [Mobiluncus mulieris ATCC 35243]EFM45414.1 hypothetical protein HMPREF0580_1915 [Mobiluncus mulieris ATCC 35239]MCU9969133.1 hypothetical protein [Mobiluncus mulieris]MCU9971058.1 hypothetical protein [Mobiluncus mulieris]MCU9973469.1 hypothetical protein [Mobiluncus mulieris]
MVLKYHLMKRTKIITRVKQEEDGRVLLLGLGTCVLLCVIVLMTMSVSGIYLEQRRLQRLADQTVSLAVAEVDDAVYYEQGLVEGAPIPIDQAGARRRAVAYLDRVDSRLTPGLKSIAITGFRTFPTRVELELAAVGNVPIALPLISSLTEVPMRAKASASLKTTFG